jgi:hypothetical protein
MVYPDGEPVGRYTVISNDILEKIASIELTREERMVLDRVIKDTVGYEEGKGWGGASIRRVTHEMPVERFVEKTGLAATEIRAALDNLERRSIIEREGDNVTFNHHLEEWV